MAKRNRKRNRVDNTPVIDSDTVINDEIEDYGSYGVYDAFTNPVARLGTNTQNLINGSTYTRKRLTHNRHLLDVLYAENWVVKRLIDTIPEDITKSWFNVTGSVTAAESVKIKTYQESINLKDQILIGLKWARLYGGCAGIILLKGQDDLSKPLDYNKIVPDSFKGLYIVNRWSGIEPLLGSTITDLNDLNFGKPEYYNISLLNSEYDTFKQTKIHHTRLIKFKGADSPPSEEYYNHGWGDSVIEPVYEELTKRDNVSHNMVSLTFRAIMDVISIDKFNQLSAVGNNMAKSRLWSTLQAQSVIQSNLGVKVIDKDEKIQQFSYGFTGLPDVYNIIKQDIAGAAKYPVSKLFAQSPSGLNATGKSELQMYNDTLNVERETYLRPIIKQILPILVLSVIGRIPDDIGFEFEAIRLPDETESATILQKKNAALLDSYTNNTIDLATYLTEQKNASDVTGTYGSITAEQIESGIGVYFADTMNDPIVGITNRSRAQLSDVTEPMDLSAAEFTDDQ